MQIDILPDPDRPLGGSALLRIREGVGLSGTLSVSVFDRSKERWLADRAWQPVPVRFGPYPISHAADGAAEITVGAEIVDHVDEYAPLTIQIGDQSIDVDWPDTILLAPGAPTLGGILGDEEPAAPLAGDVETPTEVPEPPQQVEEPVKKPEDEPPGPVDGGKTESAGGSKLPLWIAAAVVAVLLAIAAWFFLPFEDTNGGQTAGGGTVVPEEPTSMCDPSDLATVSGPLSDRLALIAECGAARPDLAISVLERGADTGDAAALLAFGRLYDDAQQDPLLEDTYGIDYTEKLNIAARYYARARDAGAPEAAAALSDVCARIADSYNDVLIESAQEFCQ